jgi:rhodanese-related sulfurtransferase
VAPTAKTLADLVRAALTEIDEMAPEDTHKLLDSEDRGGFDFVDVREADEFAAGHIPGARNYPRGFLEVRADKHHHKRDPWLEDRHRKMILYCGGGNRSALAAQTLQQMGFKHVYSLREGWSGWEDRGFQVEK